MILFLLAYLGGVLTIVSPCILPVLPFVFARGGPAVRPQRPAAAGRHGGDLRRGRHIGGRRRRLGRGGQSVRPPRGDGASGPLRHHAAVPRLVRAADAAARGAWAPGCRQSADQGAAAPGVARPVLASARRRDRPALGALRRAGPGPDPDGRGPSGRQRPDLAAAARLCGRRGHLAGPGAAGRRTGLRRDEALAGRRRMDPARAWRRGAAGGRRHRARASTRASSPASRSPARPRSSRACSTSSMPPRRRRRHPSPCPTGRR